jgi:hypothetical protein
MATEFPESVDPAQQQRTYIASGGADEDRGGNKGTTVAGKKGTPKASEQQKDQILESRRTNPLSIFSSYTYQITLYMVSAGAYNAFAETGRTNINAIGQAQTIGSLNANENNGVFIVAQSGGIGKNQNRSPYLDLDYYIDDLKITSNISPNVNKSATNTLAMSFKIVEPYGFSFITQLKLASETLKKAKTSIPGIKNANNAIQQFFVLGVRFIGYDAQGNVMTPSNAINNSLDFVSTASELYEQFYDIQITKLDFKLDGRSTVYNITANSTSINVGFGIKYGRADNNLEIEATNVEQALTKLATKLTEISQKADIKNSYKITFQGDGIDALTGAEFYSEADLNKLKSAMSASKNSKEVNDATSLRDIPKLKTRQFKIKSDTPVLQIVDDIISQSEYLTSALSVIYKANLQQKGGNTGDNQINQNENKELKWYHISPNVTVGEYNESRQDYSYQIEYIIQLYKTPVIRSAYVPKTTKYYGPHKRYSYYFTGENSEIIEYSQTYNNAFFTIQNEKDPSPQGQKNATQNQGPVVPNKRQNQTRQGDPDVSRESTNAVRTSLYDPGSTISAKITILGDPDYLILPTISNVAKVYNQYYGPNYSINANGGQVFIEISFKEAIDYDNGSKTGILDVNDKIFFWKYPKDVQDKIKGVVYQVFSVVSNFSKGKFTQVLECQMPGFAAAGDNELVDRTVTVDENQTAKTSPTEVKAPPVNPTTPSQTQTPNTASNQRTVPAKPPVTGGVSTPASNSTGTNKPDPVKDEDSGGTASSLPPFLGA